MILQQMIEQFDPDSLGLSIRIVRCLWHPAENRVRSLQVVRGVGTPPWSRDLGQRTILLGAESLAGMSVVKCRLAGASKPAEDARQNFFYWEEYEQSVLAYPLMCQARIAGCLLVASTQSDGFNK